MTRAMLAAALLASLPARGDFVRGSIKIDVRDGSGKPRAAEVSVRGGSGDVTVARVGEVYVADGLLDGDYTVGVAGAPPQTVHVKGRQDRGIVFVVGPKPLVFALAPRDAACDAVDGAVVEAVLFARGGGLGAGRLDVRDKKGKAVCSAIVAGGAATLRLLPGAYSVSARFVGGGTALVNYYFRRDETPRPLVLRAR
jgi:hypothetical protein